MQEKNLSQKVLKKIKQEKIKPKPRWEFLLRDYAIWVLSIVFLLIGSFAFAVVIFLVKHNDWAIYEQINDSLLKFTLLTLPYFWFVFLILFLVLAYYNFRHTKRGYRYKTFTILIGAVLVSLLLGVLLYNFGVGEAIDQAFAERVPFYSTLLRQRRIWTQASEGRLAGVIVSVQNKEDFEIKALDREVWRVSGDDMRVIPDPEIIRIGTRVKIFGEQKGENNFEALLVIPFFPQRFREGNLEIRDFLKNHPEVLRRMRGRMKIRRFRRFLSF